MPLYDFEGERPPYCDLCGWFHFPNEEHDDDEIWFEDEYPDIDEDD